MKVLTCTVLYCLVFSRTLSAGVEAYEKQGVEYHVIKTSPDSIRVVWQDGQGKALRTFPAVYRYLVKQGEKPEAILNGGIFEPGGIPSGLLIQNGKVLRPVNR